MQQGEIPVSAPARNGDADNFTIKGGGRALVLASRAHMCGYDEPEVSGVGGGADDDFVQQKLHRIEREVFRDKEGELAFELKDD